MATNVSDELLTTHMIEEENRLTVIEGRLQQLEDKIDTLENSIQALVDAWKTAGLVVSFIKWLAGLGMAITTLVGIFKGYK